MTITHEADLAFAGAAHQAEALRNGAVSARELTEIYLRRIEAIDPRVNSFRSVSGERALSEADACQERLRAGRSAPLLGVPVAVKDNVDVTGDPTRHGTPAEREPASVDSEVVRRLRAAGAVILGKTTLP